VLDSLLVMRLVAGRLDAPIDAEPVGRVQDLLGGVSAGDADRRGAEPLSQRKPAPDDRAHPIVGHGLLPLLGPLGQVLEDRLTPVAGHVLPADRGQAERAVLRRVLVAAGAEEPEVNEVIAAARTLSLDSPRPSRWLRTASRMPGSARPNSSIRSCLS